MLACALLVVALLAGLVLLLLTIPVHIAFRLQGVRDLSGQVVIRWFFGALRLRIDLPRAARSPPRRAAAVARVDPAEPRSRTTALRMLYQADFRRRLVRLIKDLVRAAHLRAVAVRLRLGLGDPADTGRLWAFVWPLSAAVRGFQGATLRLEPDFTEAVFDFDARGQLRLVPIQCLMLVTAFVLSPPAIRAWRSMGMSHA